MSNQMISVDIAKLGMGMKSIFTGCALLFDSLGVSGEAMEQMNELAATAVKQSAPVTEKQTSPSRTQQTESTAATTGKAAATVTDATTAGAAKTTATEDFPPADDELPFDTEDKPAVEISVKDLQKVAAQKITSNRKNSAKIQQLLTTYGCGTMSEIPEEKREAFLNDLAQL